MASRIFEEISEKSGIAIPDNPKNAQAAVRQVLKRATPDVWDSLSNESIRYLRLSQKALKQKAPIPLPADWQDRVLSVTPASEIEGEFSTNDYEPFPAATRCEKKHIVMTVESMLSLYAHGMIQIPECQRNFIWTKSEREQFLINLIADIPIPSIFLTKEPSGDRKLYVLDGLQRIMTIKSFRDGEQKIDGRKFDKLSEADRVRFLTAQLPVTEVTTAREEWPRIFVEINRGGKPLNEMELRRAIYSQGILPVLDQFAKTHEMWNNIIGRNLRFKGLSTLIRACAMHLCWEDYSKPASNFVERFCAKSHRGEIEIDFNELQIKIDKLLWALDPLGKDAFRLIGRKPLNAGLIDCIFHAGFMIIEALPNITDKKLSDNLTKFKAALEADIDAMNALTFDTSGTTAVSVRMTKTEELVKKIAGIK